MNSILDMMLRRYNRPESADQAKNIIKQCLQEIVLSGLSRSDFFSKAAFYGGTSLRIFHGLDRFSEDLDFSIDPGKNGSFKISEYKSYVDNEIESLGIPAEFLVEPDNGFVKRAYVKGNCREVFSAFGLDSSFSRKVQGNAVISVKVEADTAEITDAAFETKFLTYPYPSSVRVFDKGSLFAGKISAVLCRHWRTRIKGRDLYDYVFYVSQKYPLNMQHLRKRLEYAGALDSEADFSYKELREMLTAKFSAIDYDSAKKDVLPFISDTRMTDLWSEEFFSLLTNDYFSNK